MDGQVGTETASTKVTLKLLIDKRNQVVLFAEAGKDFVDFLFHTLKLPVGAVIRFLTNAGMVGSLGRLYDSVENLNDIYINPKQKDSLLKPKVADMDSHIPLALLNITTVSSTPRTYYRCPNTGRSSCSLYVTDDNSAKCPDCKNSMRQIVTWVNGPDSVNEGSSSGGDVGGGYVKGVVTYMVMDDLEVKPMSTISCITLLNKCNVQEIADLEERMIEFGMEEAMELLNVALQSKKVLTDVFCKKAASG